MLPLPVLAQVFVAWLSRLVELGNATLCSRWVTVLQFHGIWLAALLATLWVIAGQKRQQELHRQTRTALKRRAAASNGSYGQTDTTPDIQEVRWRALGCRL
jgi:hypothetical protein